MQQVCCWRGAPNHYPLHYLGKGTPFSIRATPVVVFWPSPGPLHPQTSGLTRHFYTEVRHHGLLSWRGGGHLGLNTCTKSQTAAWSRSGECKDSRPIPTRPICSLPKAIVGRLESADWMGVEILNMFNTGSRLTITKSVVEYGLTQG